MRRAPRLLGLFALAVLAAGPPDGRGGILYDNGPFMTHRGTGVGGADESWVQTSIDLHAFGFLHRVGTVDLIADDFAVPDGWEWTVDHVTFFAYQPDAPTAPSSMSWVLLVILDAAPDVPSADVLFGDWWTNRLTSSGWTGCYRVEDAQSGTSDERPIMTLGCDVTPPLELSAGTYWVVWQTDGDLVYGPYTPPVTLVGQTTTGNALVSEDGGRTYGPARDNWFQQGFPFLIEGIGIDTAVEPATWGALKALFR